MAGRNQSQSAWEVIESDVYLVGMRWSSIEVKYAESYWHLLGGTRFMYRDREMLIEDGKMWDVTAGQRVQVGWKSSSASMLLVDDDDAPEP